MKRNTKRVFSLSALLKLFFLTSITAGNPVKTIKESDTRVNIIYVTNETLKHMNTTAFNGFIPKETIVRTINNVLPAK